VTATAIVIDRAGKHKILLPDYALMLNDTEYALSPAGPLIARASKPDVVLSDIDRGVVLASIDSGVNTSNVLSTSAELKEIGSLPPIGSQLTLITNRRSANGVLRRTKGLFAVTTERITEPGEGGAPVLDSSGHLVAMGYAGTERGESELLSLKWAFDKAGLRLAP